MQILSFLSGAIFGGALVAFLMFWLAFRKPGKPSVADEWSNGSG